MCFIVTPNSRFKNMKDLIEIARANPKKIKITTAGLMTTSDIAAIQLEQASGVKFAHMFCEQQGEQRGALLGGHADVEFNPVSETATSITGVELRSLGLCDSKRSRYMPEIPTVMSQGFKARMASCRGLAAPADTPDDKIKIIADVLKKALENPEAVKLLDKIMLTTRFMAGKEHD